MTFSYSGMILAAGFGKRMMPLTKDKPKPLIEINRITLLENSINFLIKLGCKEIIINTHYHHSQIQNFIYDNFYKKNIKLVYEKEILDTGGAVKNANSFFSNKNILVINSDIYWQNNNLIDARTLIQSYFKNYNMHILLSKKNKSFGISKNKGDFIIKDSKVSRFSKGEEVIFYSGLQILHLENLKDFTNNKFSFNIVWDHFIKKNSLFGKIMTSDWYHVGDIQGLNIARKLGS